MRTVLGLIAVAVSSHLAGCASTELTFNTLDIASTTDDLMTEQVFHNLSDFIDSDLAYPTQLVIGSGTATTNDSLTANYTDPLTFAVQNTTTSSGCCSSDHQYVAETDCANGNHYHHYNKHPTYNSIESASRLADWENEQFTWCWGHIRSYTILVLCAGHRRIPRCTPHGVVSLRGGEFGVRPTEGRKGS
jgi:hypothetical protein